MQRFYLSRLIEAIKFRMEQLELKPRGKLPLALYEADMAPENRR